jgi:hypothetical protein
MVMGGLVVVVVVMVGRVAHGVSLGGVAPSGK